MIRSLFSKIRDLFTGQKKEPLKPGKDVSIPLKGFRFKDERKRNKSRDKSLKKPQKPSRETTSAQKDQKPRTRPESGVKQAPKKAPVSEKKTREIPKKPQKPRKPPWNIEEFKVEPEEGKTRFHDLNLSVKLMHAIFELGFKFCTPIQAGILPDTTTGKDAVGRAQTGTGKSAAFIVTIMNHLLKNPLRGKRTPGYPRALILAPTRELALQIEKDANGLAKFSRSRVLSIYGGQGYEKQKKILAERIVDIVVATPGRLIDFKKQNLINLKKIEVLVIDEADRMLDMGFIPDIKQIVYSTPPKAQRQTLFFSATITPEVKRLADQWTKEPVFVEIEPEQVASEAIKQIIYIVTANEKFPLLYNMITQQKLDRVIVFANRRDQTRELVEKLQSHGINCALLSGEIAQNKRIKALEDFKAGKTTVLVATDVAARGIHIEGVSHVINYNLPQDPEHYVHRIGRTGRAGASGISISYACEDDSFNIPAIEEFLGQEFSCEHPDDELLVEPPPPVAVPEKIVVQQTQKPARRNGHKKPPYRPKKSGQRPGPNGRRKPNGYKYKKRNGSGPEKSENKSDNNSQGN